MKPYLLAFAVYGAAGVSGCGDTAPCVEGGCDDGNPCTTDECNPTTEACESTAVPDTSICLLDDGPGLCASGQCISMSCEGVLCDDENPCTADGCSEGLGACVFLALQDATTCEIDGAFGLCLEGECDLGNPPSGEADFRLTIVDAAPAVVSYVFACAADITVAGSFARSGDEWSVDIELPAGECTIQAIARDQDGEVICDGEQTVQIVPDARTSFDLVLSCGL